VAQLVEQRTENPRVGGSIPSRTTICERKWLRGRAPPCQGGGRGFESRLPLHFYFRPGWRNGRRTGLKIPGWVFHRVGSSPTLGTSGSPGGFTDRGFFCVFFSDAVGMEREWLGS